MTRLSMPAAMLTIAALILPIGTAPALADATTPILTGATTPVLTSAPAAAAAVGPAAAAPAVAAPAVAAPAAVAPAAVAQADAPIGSPDTSTPAPAASAMPAASGAPAAPGSPNPQPSSRGNNPNRHGQPAGTGDELLPPNRTTREEAKKRSIIDLTLSIAKGDALGKDQIVKPGELNDNELLPAGLLLINVTPRLSLFERRTNHADVSGGIIKKGKETYSGLGYDIEYDTGGTYAATKDLDLDVFDRVRWRMCCPGAGDPHNTQPRLERALVVGATYRFGPKTVVGRPITAHLEAVDVDHHLDNGTVVPKGIKAPGSLIVYRSSLFFQVPIFGRQVVPFIGFEHFYDYFDNNIVPSNTNRSDVGIRIRGTPFISYRAYVQNDHQTNPAGNVPHKVTLYMETAFHFHH